MRGDEVHRQAACAGKERLTASLARRVATKRRGQGRTFRRRQAYRCRFCGYWHVGTPTGRS